MNEDFWKKFPPIPGFDCLKMKNDIQSKIYEEIKDMSSDERVAYFNRAGARFRQSGQIGGFDTEPLLVKEDTDFYNAKPPRQG